MQHITMREARAHQRSVEAGTVPPDVAHLRDETQPCNQCGARWTREVDGSGTMLHADTCCYLAGVGPGHPQYGPAWIAGCYGVEVNDPCPPVRLPSAGVVAARASNAAEEAGT